MKKIKNTILYLPEGEHDLFATVNGKPGERRVNVTPDCVSLLQRDLDAKIAAGKARQAARPCGYFDHRTGPAAYRPQRFEWSPGRGVLLHVEWTQSGKDAVQGHDYGYVSPTFMIDPDTRRVVGLPATEEVGSLVNNPAFERTEEITASRGDSNLPPRDALARTIPLPYNDDTMIEKIKRMLGLAPDVADDEVLSALTAAIGEKKGSAEALAAAEEEKKKAFAERDAAKEEAKRQEEECKAARAQLEKQKEDSADASVKEAIAAGKIAPKDEEAQKAWRGFFLSDPQGARKAMESVAASSVFSPGIQGQPSEGKLPGLDEVYGASYK